MTERIVYIQMPVELSREMLQAVANHPMTSTESVDEQHRRIGWLLCAWDVLREARSLPLQTAATIQIEPSVRKAAELVVSARDQFGWSTEADEQIEALRVALERSRKVRNG